MDNAARDRQSLGEAARRIEVSRQEKAAAEVRNCIERGQACEGKENFDAAIKEYQKALAILSWYTDQRDFGVTADRVRDMIDYAKLLAEAHDRLARQEQIRAAQMEQELPGERERRLNEIRAYFDEAHRAFRRGEYVLAREYAKQILMLDPQSVDAEQLICISYDAQHHRNEAESRRLFDDQWKAVFADLERNTFPQVATFEFPKNWLDGIVQHRPRVVGDDFEDDDASIAAILTTLDTKRVKGLTWEAANLDQVVQYLRTITGLNFFITPRVRAEVYDEVEISMDLDDVTVRTVLDLATEPYELRWTPENGVVRIDTKDKVRGDMYVRYFDSKDLTIAIGGFAGSSILLPSDFTPPEPPEAREPTSMPLEAGLVALIKDTICGEEAWEDPATIEVRNRIIIARNTPAILDQVQQLLNEIRTSGGLLVRLESHRWGTVSGAPPRSLDR